MKRLYSIENNQLVIVDEEIGLNIQESFELPSFEDSPKLSNDCFQVKEENDEKFFLKEKKRYGELLQYYPRSEKLLAKMYYENDLLHGPCYYYSRNGKVLTESWFYRGKRQGQSRQYYSSGKIYSEERYIDDEHEMSQTYYYENGQVKTKVQYDKGKLEGKAVLYFESGKIKRGKCGLRHGMRNQQTTTKRNLGHTGYVDDASKKAMKVMLPYGTK